MVFTFSSFCGEPVAKLRDMLSAPSGSTPYTLQRDCICFTAQAMPAIRPPPPTGTITASRVSIWLQSS
jgi:hypothetical protein